MSRTPRIVVGLVAMLSLLGLGGVVSVAATPDSAPVVSSAPVVTANRWCC